MDRDIVIAALRAHERELNDAGVVRLSLFGSAGAGDNGPNSNIDLLAAFNAARRISLLDVNHIQDQIAGLLSCPVELAEEGTFKPLVQRRVDGGENPYRKLRRALKIRRRLTLAVNLAVAASTSNHPSASSKPGPPHLLLPLLIRYHSIKAMARLSYVIAAAAATAALLTVPFVIAQNHDLGFTDTPMLPGLPWHVHDPNRPHPPVVTPAATPGGAPSDAIVLFDGTDLSAWAAHHSDITKAGAAGAPEWRVTDGYMEVVHGTGDIVTKEKFGDCQLHVEWASPAVVKGDSQARGNSGVILQSRYEVQVLDTYNNPTYADGQTAAIYGQWPPLANAARKPGEWQTYDIVFIAPRFNGDTLVSPAYITVFWNGVMVHDHKASMGPMVYRHVAHYSPQPAEDALLLQNHNDPVRFRNIWIRRLHDYDQPQR